MSLKVSPDVKAVLERIQEGQKPSRSERIGILEELEYHNTLTAEQLAKLLGVTTRTVRADRAELRKRYEQALKDLHLLGEIYRQWKISLSRIDEAIAEGDYKRVRALSQRWGVCEGFLKLSLPYQLDELAVLVEKARNRLNGGEE